jgi:predicted negative regulator of RcsB-dependent stress response
MKKHQIALVIFCTMVIVVMNSTGAFAKSQFNNGKELAKIQSFLELMDNYLNVSKKWVKMASERETTIYVVIERITEIYERKSAKVDAVPELRKILAKYKDNPTIGNIIHFKIAELYKNSGQANKALEELNAIVEADRNR